MRGGWVVPFSSGRAFARSNDREKKESAPAAPRLLGLRAMKVPVFVPKKVVARPSGEPYGRLQGNRGTLASLGSPSGAARRRLGLAFAIYNGSTIPLSAPRGLCENHPNLRAELPLHPR